MDDSWPPLGADAPQPGPRGADTSSNYYIVLDASGSMRETECSGGKRKIEAAVTALGRFVAAVPPTANLGLLVFDDDGVTERVPLGRDNRDGLRNALRDVRAAGGTPLRTAIGQGYAQLTTQALRQLGYGEYHLVVVTDGKPDPSDEDPTPVVDELLAKTPVVLHTIGFCIGTDHVLNQQGRSYYVAADSPDELLAGLTAVLAEAPKFDAASFE
jgi:uncharacterized protein with von Willebrand factor type A (vWA) domain